jgi:hypothetical protein
VAPWANGDIVICMVRRIYKSIFSTGTIMNNKDVFHDKQLLHKIEGRLVTTSTRAKTQKTVRTNKDPVERDGPSLPFLYQG